MKSPITRSTTFLPATIAFVFIAFLLPSTQAHAASNAWQAVGQPDFSSGVAYYPSLVVDSNGNPYIGYGDGAGNNAAVVEGYNATSSLWYSIGNAHFSASSTLYFNLGIDSNNTLYAAYDDANSSYKESVMKYTGSTWTQVGTAGFTPGSAIFDTFALDASNTPYVAYLDGAASGKVSVMKYTGGVWTQVGSAGFSTSTAQYISLAFDANNTPYVAYEDAGYSNKATVMAYTGGAWTVVGTAGFTGGQAQFDSLKFGPNNTPYIAYQDASNGYYVSVMKYSSGAWSAVGSLGFSPGGADDMSLAFASSTPYVGFRDDAHGSAPSVMYFNGTSWQPYGSYGFGTGYVGNGLALVFTKNNVPYIAYSDGANNEKANVLSFGLPGPTLSQTTAVPSSSTNTTPSYTFTSDQGGTIYYGGTCSSNTTTANAGANTITLNALGVGTYSNCTITVVNNASQASTPLAISSFTITAPVVTPSQPLGNGSSGGGMVYGCKDPSATNYTEFAASDPAMCVYGGASSSASSTTSSVSASTATSTPITTYNPGGPMIPATSTPSSATSSPGSTASFTRDLKRGMSGTDVTELQQFLITANTGASAEALAAAGTTTYFGSLTKAALIEYQKAHDITPAVGYFGPITRAYVKSH